MTKTLDTKIKRILADPSCKDFILADAKDADMAAGMAAPGSSHEAMARGEKRFRTLAEYRQAIRENVKQGLVDIMLMSASTNDLLTIKERLFDDSPITPAARANDTTDIHLAAGSVYAKKPSRPFRTATIDHIMHGKVNPPAGSPVAGADLGLYSVTFNNDLDRDLATLEAYKAFRLEAEAKGFRHFLEVFDPNACGDNCPSDLGRFINDMIARTLAGVVGKGRPIFLKIAYHGPAAMEQLASYDRTLIPGILGGAAGTTFDAFFQLWEARKHGARAALYGRMINGAEHQGTFIQHLRWLADGEMNDPADAVKSYHAALAKQKIKPLRKLEDDLAATLRQTAYSGTSSGKSRASGASGGLPTSAAGRKTRAVKPPVAPRARTGRAAAGQPDFSKMTQAEKIAWNRDRWKRILG